MFVDPTGMYAFGDGWNWLKKNVFAPVRQFVDDAFNYLNNLPDWVGEVAVLVGVAAFAFVFGPLIMATNAMDTAGPEATREFFGTLGNIGAFVIGGFGDAFAGFVDLIGKLNFDWPTGSEGIRGFYRDIQELFAGGLFGRVIDFFRNRQSNGKQVKIEDERTEDWKMRALCRNYVDSISETEWYNSLDKEGILIALFNYCKARGIMNLSTNVKMKIESLPDENGVHDSGGYTDFNTTLYINADDLNNPDSYTLLKTVVHELRHAYQYEAINGIGNHVVSQATINAWKDSIPPHYLQKGDIVNGVVVTHAMYASQAIEWDAFNFANQIDSLHGANPSYRGSW